MTLSTLIVVGNPDVDHPEVYNLFRKLVLTRPQAPCEIKEKDGVVHIDTPPGTGAYAWLLTKRNQDRSPFVHTCDEWCDDVVGERTIYLSYKDEYYTRTITAKEVEDHDKYRAGNYDENGKGYIVVDIDTAYSFHEVHPEFPELGVMSCTSFHAFVITQFGAWMDQQHSEVLWWWRNEYSGEWFEKLDGLGLEKFLDSEFDRSMWFECMVKPAIANMVGADMDVVWHGSNNEIPKEG
jgi:hypothetical protein